MSDTPERFVATEVRRLQGEIRRLKTIHYGRAVAARRTLRCDRCERCVTLVPGLIAPDARGHRRIRNQPCPRCGGRLRTFRGFQARANRS